MSKQQPRRKPVVAIDLNRILTHSSQGGIDEYFEQYLEPPPAAIRKNGPDADNSSVPSGSIPNILVDSGIVPSSSVDSNTVPIEPVANPSSEVVYLTPRRPPRREGQGSESGGFVGSCSVPSEAVPSRPEGTAPFLPYAVQTGRTANTRRRIFEPKRVQDAHTPAEEKVWREMLALARNPKFGRIGANFDTYCWASQPEIARRAQMHENNVRNILRSLQAKLSIELYDDTVDRNRARGRTWRIPPFDEILENRRRAGLIRAVRGNSIRFVTEAEIERWQQEENSSEDSSFVGTQLQLDDTFVATGSVPTVRTKLLGTEGTKLPASKEVLRNAVEVKTAAAPAALGALVLSAVGAAADAGLDFVNRVWREATAAVPDATPEEVASFVGQLWQTFSRKKSIHNPTGIVISSIGSTMKLQIEAHRKSVEAEQQRAEQARIEAIEVWTEIMNDPNESPESRQRARDILQDYGVEIP